MLIESAKDIFWLVLAFCILWLTLFFTWMLYYIIRMMRQVSQITDRVHRIVDNVEKLVMSLKQKSDNAGAYIAAILKGSQQVKEFIDQRRSRGRKNKTK